MNTFTYMIKTTKYSHKSKENNYCRIWYKYKMDQLIRNDKEVTLIDEPDNINKCDYCNLSKYSNTSYRLYSFNTKLFGNKHKTYLFLREFNCVPLKYSNELPINNKLWFVKPLYGTEGKGITITNNPDKVYNNLLEQSIQDKYTIEESIDMRLIRERRWDLRIYVYHTINSNGELSTYLYNNGLVRLCPDIFDKENISKRNMCSNTSLYKDIDRENNLNFLFTNIENYDTILNDIKILLSKIHQKMKNELKFNDKFILETQLLGYDLIIDINSKIYIIEINAFPQYIINNNTPEIKTMKSQLITDIYSLIKSYYLNKTIKTNFILI